MSEKDTNNTSGKDEKDLQDQQPIQYVQVTPYGYPPEDDEIDLADLFAVLYRRKKLIAAVTILFVLLAFGMTKIMPKKFKAETMVEIGQISVGGKYQKIESSEAVSNRISSLAKLTALEISEETETLGFSVKDDLEVDIPKEGNVATIGLTVAEDATDKGLDFLSRVNDKLNQEYTHFFEQYKNEIRAEIAAKEAEIDTMDSAISNLSEKIAGIKTQFEERKKAQQDRVDELNRRMHNAEVRQEAIQTELESLRSEKEELTRKIDEVEGRYAEYMESGTVTGSGETPAERMFFNTEMLYLSQMRERLLVKIPQQTRELQAELKALDERLEELRMEKERETERLLALSPEMSGEIEKHQNQILEWEKAKGQLAANIEREQNKLDNMITTRVYVKPRLSDKPISPNVKLIVALGLVGGFFLAVFLAFMAEFWYRNKQKITG